MRSSPTERFNVYLEKLTKADLTGTQRNCDPLQLSPPAGESTQDVEDVVQGCQKNWQFAFLWASPTMQT